MQESYINTTVCRDEEGSAHTFRYSITTDQLPAGRFICEHYGVRVERADGEAAELRSITCSRSQLERLMAALVRNAVSPTELPYVVEDWLQSPQE